MIQLYLPENTNYDQNGNMVLLPEEATVKAVLNGTWGAKLVHPIDDEGRWSYIAENCVVKMPSFQSNDQLFRIYDVEKNDTEITCSMDPIFYDSASEVVLVDVRPTDKNGQGALSYLLQNASITDAVRNKYSVKSNISTVNTAYYYEKNLMQAICGEDDNAFLNRWGGEAYFNNYNLTINNSIGSDRGVELRYGKNIPNDGVEEHIDFSNVITRVVPVVFNGYYPGKQDNIRYVYSSPIMSEYPLIRYAFIKFSDIKMAEDATEEDYNSGSGITVVNDEEELKNELRIRINNLYELDGIDKPVVSVKINMSLLQNADSYEDYKVIETVSLGDTVHLIHNRLNIRTDARIIELEYDSVNKKVVSVVIGKKKKDQFEKINDSATVLENITTPSGSVNAEKIKGILNAMNTQLRYQKNIAEKQDVRAILFEDLDEDSKTYGAMSIGTQGLQIADKRTADGSDWDWTTAFTARGGYADAIITGILSSKDGKSYFDLDSGLLHAINAEIEGIITGSTIKGSEISGSNISSRNGNIELLLDNGEFSVFNYNADSEYRKAGRIYTETETLSRFNGTSVVNYIVSKLLLDATRYFQVSVNGEKVFHINYNEGIFTGDQPSISSVFANNLSVNGKVFANGITSRGDVYISSTDLSNDVELSVMGNVSVKGNLNVLNSKNRAVNLNDGTTKLLYAYETATPYFGDIGTGRINSNGECFVAIDYIFSETVNTGVEYNVFLQKEGPGDLWVKEKTPYYFIVCGSENLPFSWEIKSIQKNFENKRLEDMEYTKNVKTDDIDKILYSMFEKNCNEMEDLLNGNFESFSDY